MCLSHFISASDYCEKAVDFAKMVDIHTGNSGMLVLIAIEIQTARKNTDSVMNVIAETVANNDKAVDLSSLDGGEANPFVEKTESDMERD